MAERKNSEENALQYIKGVGPKRAEALIADGFFNADRFTVLLSACLC